MDVLSNVLVARRLKFESCGSSASKLDVLVLSVAPRGESVMPGVRRFERPSVSSICVVLQNLFTFKTKSGCFPSFHSFALYSIKMVKSKQSDVLPLSGGVGVRRMRKHMTVFVKCACVFVTTIRCVNFYVVFGFVSL